MQLAVNRARATISVIILLATSILASDWDRGVGLYNKGDYKAALAEFQDIVMERPDAAGAWYYIGLCEVKLKRYGRVELALLHAIELPAIPTASSPGGARGPFTTCISHYLLSPFHKGLH